MDSFITHHGEREFWFLREAIGENCRSGEHVRHFPNGIKEKARIEDERASLFEETRKWMLRGGESEANFCEDAPNIADISMFGVFRAVKTFQAFEDVCKEVPEMVPWYEKMKEAVGRVLGRTG